MAFRNVESLAKDLSKTKAVSDIVWSKKEKWRRTLGWAKEWQKQQMGMTVVKVEHTLSSLRTSLEGTKGKLEEVFSEDYSEFTRYIYTPEHLCILGSDEKVPGYRTRYDPRFVGQLSASTSRLPPVLPHQTERGEFEERHYAVWAVYAVRSVPSVSFEFRKDNKKKEAASGWIEANRDLLKAVNNAHRCIVPGEYSRVLAAEIRMAKGLRIGPLFRSSCGAAIHEKISGQFASCLHRNSKDYRLCQEAT
jgi:hypothetical protein